MIVDYVLYTCAGPEIAVASTKAYTTQFVLLILLAYYIAQNWNQDVHDDVIKQLQLYSSTCGQYFKR